MSSSKFAFFTRINTDFHAVSTQKLFCLVALHVSVFTTPTSSASLGTSQLMLTLFQTSLVAPKHFPNSCAIPERRIQDLRQTQTTTKVTAGRTADTRASCRRTPKSFHHTTRTKPNLQACRKQTAAHSPVMATCHSRPSVPR